MTPDTISPISQFGPIAKEHPEEPVWLRKDCIRELAHTLRHQELPTNRTIVRSSTRSSAILASSRGIAIDFSARWSDRGEA